jgi:hypothetical protein
MSKDLIIEEFKKYGDNFSLHIVPNLRDSINEKVYIIKVDFKEEDSYCEQITACEALANPLRAFLEELSTGDSLLVLEADFNTNNHYFFIISENE